MKKPIDRVKETIANREAMGLCQWLLDFPRFVYSRYRCKKVVMGNNEDLQAGDEPCKLEDWVVCPLNKEVK